MRAMKILEEAHVAGFRARELLKGAFERGVFGFTGEGDIGGEGGLLEIEIQAQVGEHGSEAAPDRRVGACALMKATIASICSPSVRRTPSSTAFRFVKRLCSI